MILPLNHKGGLSDQEDLTLTSIKERNLSECCKSWPAPRPRAPLSDGIAGWGPRLAVRPWVRRARRPRQARLSFILSRNNNRVALQADHVAWCAAGEESTFCIMFVKVERLKPSFMKNPFVCAVVIGFFFSSSSFCGDWNSCDFRGPRESFTLEELIQQALSRNASLTLGSCLKGAFWDQIML